MCVEKKAKSVIGYDANSLHPYCSVDVMLFGKGRLVVNKKLFDQKRSAKFSKDVLIGKCFGFSQVDIELPDELYDNFSKMAPLFVTRDS